MSDFQTALADEQAGRWPAAYAGYRAIVGQNARNAPALHRLGLAAYHLGRRGEALDWLQQALAVEKSPDLLLDFASVLQETGQWAAAAAAFTAALQLAPHSIDGRFGLAVCLHQSGRLADAADAYRAVIAARPDIAVAHENLGRALLGVNRPAEAIRALREAVRLAPQAAGAWNNLGSALHTTGQTGATAAFRAALNADPEHAGARQNLCLLLTDAADRAAGPAFRHLAALTPADSDGWALAARWRLAVGDSAAALTAARRAAVLAPDSVGAQNMLGNVLLANREWAAAAAVYRVAICGRPDETAPALNLADALTALGRREAAAALLRRVMILSPQNGRAWRIRGGLSRHELQHDAALAAGRIAAALDPADAPTLMDLGGAALRAKRPDIAEKAYRRALALTPDDAAALGHLVELKMLACDWAALQPLESRLLARVGQGGAAGVSPFILLATAASPADQKIAAADWARTKATVPIVRPAPRADSGGRIRIGYLSSDFREHAISYLLAGMLEAHDRDRFAIHGYSIGPDDSSPMRQRIIDGVEYFVDLRTESDNAAARRIADDQIDILVDVNGYTAFARSPIMAARPAAVQVNWLGYPGTLGADFIDYIIADHHLIGPGDEADYTEAVVRLPHCYQPNDRRRPIADATPTRAACGLPAAAMVFCCFNNLYKITAGTFAVWLEILRATPDSVLWLLEGHPVAMDHLRRAMIAGGVGAERLIFAPPTPLPQHLARHRLADLFLDTLPYNAHTTGSDALWAGLPVITCRGTTFPGRVGASLTAAAGLPELAVDSLAAYQELALALARDPARRQGLKQRLAAQRLTCPLFDPVGFCRHLETAFAIMDARRRAGLPPQAIDIAATDSNQ